MGLAALFNVPVDDQTLMEWSFNHAAHHRDINRKIYEIFHVALPEYALDPFEPKNFGAWAAQHQVMHTNQNAILSISGNDLIDVNWEDEGERAEWIFLDADEHRLAGDILGV